jgi:hypothetical protein
MSVPASLLKLLPAGTDAAWFESELERIKANIPEKLEQQCHDLLDQVRRADQALEALQRLSVPALNKPALIAFRDERQTEADFIARHKPRWRRWRLYELLDLAKRVRVNLGYTSKPKSETARARVDGSVDKPVPYGPGIDYLLEAAAAIGAPVKADRARRLLQIYERMQLRAELGGTVGLKVDNAGITVVDRFGNVRSDP